MLACNRILTALILFLAGCASAPAPPPGRAPSPELPWGLRGVLELPRSPGPHPGIVLLPGAGGWAPRWARAARLFADSGFATLALDYYGVDGPETTSLDGVMKLQRWKANIRNSVRLLRHSAAKGQPVALVGFSRGAFLAVMVANRTSGVAAVVDFYGGAQVQPDSVARQLRDFPPLLILHGDADRIVPVDEAYRLKDLVEARGGRVEMHIYPGGDHGLTNPDTLRDATRRTVEFLRRQFGVAASRPAVTQ